MFCNYCRALNPNDATYCSACGRTISFSTSRAGDPPRDEERASGIVDSLQETPKAQLEQPIVASYSAQELEKLPDEELDKIWATNAELQIMPSVAIQNELTRRAVAPRSASATQANSQIQSASSKASSNSLGVKELKSPLPPSADWMALLNASSTTDIKTNADAPFRVKSNTETRTNQEALESLKGPVSASWVGVFRDGKDLIVTRGSALPNYCISCGGPARTVLQKTMRWHPSWLVLLIFLGFLPYLIGVLLVRSTMDLKLPLCTAHREKHRNLRRVAAGLLLAAAALLFSCFYLSESNVSTALFLGLASLLAAGIVWEVASRVLRSRFIDREKGVFRGANEVFLLKCTPKPPAMKTSA
jgi:hypothetical protein